MKFSDGFWLNRNNYSVSYASQAYEVAHSSDSVSVLATSSIINNRAMTLTGPNLEIVFSSPFENVIKVSIVHYKGGLNNSPEYELYSKDGFTPIINDMPEYTEMISGETSVKINKGRTWSIQFFYQGKMLTYCDEKTTSYITENRNSIRCREAEADDDSFWDYPHGRNSSYLREQLSLDINENIYGFGEKFTPFVKNGQSVDIWNSDGGTCTGQSYKSVPFYISSKGYGVFVNSTDRVSYEVASDCVSKVSFTVPGEKLEYFIISGKDLYEVISNYTLLSGRPALPPAYSFGLWLSTSFTTDYNEETVMSFIDGMAERDIPLQVFHFDCFWMKEFEWSSFKWDNRGFPDPKGMLDKIKERGISISVWTNPYIAQRSQLFDEGMENGYFIHNPDGSVFQCDSWQPGMAVVDFTNPSACKWFAEKLSILCEMGVTCFKTDFGERIPADVKYFNGMDSVKMHNYYTFLYNKTVFEVLEKYYGHNKACLFARSATAGSQKYPVHWGGDCSASYVSMAESLRGGLSLCCSGFGFFSHDIGGFEATATPDIYKRWCAFGLLSSHSRLHGNTSYRVPWLFDDESVEVLKFFTKLKGRLMPYLYSQAVKTSKTGIPMMRAMFMEYPDDKICLNLDKQYMLGDSLLVAPVFNDKSIAEFYLPEGRWTDIITGEIFRGGRFYTRTCSYFEIPLLVKANSAIVFGDFKNDFEYDYLNNSEITIFNLESGNTAEVSVVDTDGNEIIHISAERNINEMIIRHSPTDKCFNILIDKTDCFTQITPETENELTIVF